ncbi:hypothetical protein F5Y01DRAFT_289562 [Xylaria sp. FL0043]|nr:hypothetical protein F5Y01DRAFT_289562 [Xylaria sp. FL0043]
MATVTALAAVIGYIGAEVAEDYMLERLLWPQRFNNETSISTLLQQSLLMTAGGPLHKAALKVLENLRIQGLFTGPCRGHMLGTVFFPEMKIMHYQRCKTERALIPEKSRNAFWIRVLQCIKADEHMKLKVPRQDTEQNQVSDDYRSLQPVYHLKLAIVKNDKKPSPDEVCVSEDRTNVSVVISCLCSELPSLIASVVAGSKLHNILFCIYMLVPLLLKVLLIAFSVRRVNLASDKDLQKVAKNEDNDIALSQAFEVADPIHKFMVIEGPQPVVVQFFRHYGHPRRDQNSLWVGDRFRELACIAIVCCLFLYFPVGLALAQLSDEYAQYLWLGYELYAVVVMHIVRIFGWQDLGRTEGRIAKLLGNGKTVWLKTETGCMVSACLVVHGVSKTSEGREKVKEIIQQCQPHQPQVDNPTALRLRARGPSPSR